MEKSPFSVIEFSSADLKDVSLDCFRHFGSGNRSSVRTEFLQM